MGVWMCSQCDAYLPVATAAQKAFTAAFSENKQAEVLGFCKKEINEVLKIIYIYGSINFTKAC